MTPFSWFRRSHGPRRFAARRRVLPVAALGEQAFSSRVFRRTKHSGGQVFFHAISGDFIWATFVSPCGGRSAINHSQKVPSKRVSEEVITKTGSPSLSSASSSTLSESSHPRQRFLYQEYSRILRLEPYWAIATGEAEQQIPTSNLWPFVSSNRPCAVSLIFIPAE